MKPVARLGLVAGLLGGVFIAGRASGLTADLSTERVRAIVDGAGAWGALVYVALFAALQLVQVPALLLSIAGVLAFGRFGGAVLAYAGSVVSVSLSFVVVRGLGGQPLGELRNRRAQALLGQLERRPFWVVFVLRALFLASPPITYALALSRVRYREYLAGSAAGLVVPCAVVAALFGTWLG
jgi:uncharacterized membrane protein YdjX (TVP38/TMEM64 family)